MNINETLTLFAIMLAPAFISLIGLGAFGSPIVATLGEMAAKTKQRVFYDKYGQQTATMGRILLILLLATYAAAIGVAYARFPMFIERFTPFIQSATGVLASFGAFVVLGLVYMFTWKAMRSTKGLHIVLGAAASLASAASIAQIVPAKLLMTLTAETTPTATQAQPMALAMAVAFTLFTVTAAAGLSCAFLVLRRNKDDFGRDYYNFALRLAARWAAIPMLGFLACQGWLMLVLPETFRTLTMGTPLLYVWIGVAVLAAVCLILWVIVARSKTPLQVKGIAFVAALLLWVMHAGNATLFMNFMSMF